ncbi:MAG: Fe-S cluster assembly protein HesB [Planctomycetota bacterium]
MTSPHTTTRRGRAATTETVARPQRQSLRVPPPFELRLAAHGHGWVDLPPFAWDEDDDTLHVVLEPGLDPTSAIDVVVRQTAADRLQLECRGHRALSRQQMAKLTNRVAVMLRLDQQLDAFWALCAGTPRLQWAQARGAGRLLRAPTVFEDLMKLLFTTNCSWAATRKMTERTVATLGSASPSGKRAFPGAARCAVEPAAFWRDEVRTGYRAEACVALAGAFADGRLSEAWFTDPDLPTDELRRRLLTIRGFGPYAAGQALRLLGHYDDLALDSWCRARLAELRGKKKAPSDKTVMREYLPFGRYAGLALWLDLTRAWHEPGEPRLV